MNDKTEAGKCPPTLTNTQQEKPDPISTKKARKASAWQHAKPSILPALLPCSFLRETRCSTSRTQAKRLQKGQAHDCWTIRRPAPPLCLCSDALRQQLLGERQGRSHADWPLSILQSNQSHADAAASSQLVLTQRASRSARTHAHTHAHTHTQAPRRSTHGPDGPAVRRAGDARRPEAARGARRSHNASLRHCRARRA